jgi:hypothetical protein
MSRRGRLDIGARRNLGLIPGRFDSVALLLDYTHDRCHCLQCNLFAAFNSRMIVAGQQAPVDLQQTFVAYFHVLMQSTTIVQTSLSLSLQHLESLLVFGILQAFSVRVQP